MPKKAKPPVRTSTQKGLALIQQAETFVNENKNLVYIAIIGSCLSITILYKLGQYFGIWT